MQAWAADFAESAHCFGLFGQSPLQGVSGCDYFAS
jgi:hypothetical protein